MDNQKKADTARSALAILDSIPIERPATPADWAKRQDPESVLHRVILELEGYVRQVDPPRRRSPAPT